MAGDDRYVGQDVGGPACMREMSLNCQRDIDQLEIGAMGIGALQSLK